MQYEGTSQLKSRGVRAFRARKIVKNYYWFDKIEKRRKKKSILYVT